MRYAIWEFFAPREEWRPYTNAAGEFDAQEVASARLEYEDEDGDSPITAVAVIDRESTPAEVRMQILTADWLPLIAKPVDSDAVAAFLAAIHKST